MSLAPPRPLTGRRVLALVLAFFAVVFLANGAFVWLALTSWTGIDTENAYVEGLNYDETLRRAARQRALGWRLEHVLAGDRAGRRLEVRLSDRDGFPVGGVEVGAELRRPTHQAEDVRLTLGADGEGRFRSDAFALAPGQWDLVVRVGRGGETLYRRDARIWVK